MRTQVGPGEELTGVPSEDESGHQAIAMFTEGPKRDSAARLGSKGSTRSSPCLLRDGCHHPI